MKMGGLFIRVFAKAVRESSKSQMKNKKVAFLTVRQIYKVFKNPFIN